jgi:hypothetical protein
LKEHPQFKRPPKLAKLLAGCPLFEVHPDPTQPTSRVVRLAAGQAPEISPPDVNKIFKAPELKALAERLAAASLLRYPPQTVAWALMFHEQDPDERSLPLVHIGAPLVKALIALCSPRASKTQYSFSLDTVRESTLTGTLMNLPVLDDVGYFMSVIFGCIVHPFIHPVVWLQPYQILPAAAGLLGACKQPA